VTALPAHVPERHIVPDGNFRHAPCPSQVPSLPHVETSVRGHVDAERGGRPAGTSVHVPIDPCTLHALHVSPQAESQHTPSTQKPD
jgi:hypothetical protein